MVRRKPPAPTPPVRGAIPAELLDPDSAVWTSDATTAAWCRRHRVPFRSSDPRPGPWPSNRRWNGAAERWAVARGLTNASWPRFADWDAVAALGITARQPALERAEIRAGRDDATA